MYLYSTPFAAVDRRPDADARVMLSMRYFHIKRPPLHRKKAKTAALPTSYRPFSDVYRHRLHRHIRLGDRAASRRHLGISNLSPVSPMFDMSRLF